MRTSLGWMVIACLVPAAAAQQILWQKEGKLDEENLGDPVRFVGDVDRDGYDDLMTLVGTRGPNDEFITKIYTISGRDGRTLRSVHWPKDATSWWIYRWIARAGDVDGDGYPDYAALRYDNDWRSAVDAVDLRSGRDDRVLWTVRAPAWGAFSPPVLLGDVDLNGDTRPDLLVSAPNPPAGPAVYAYDHTGRLLYRLPHRTASLGRIGDFDADGCDDFVMGWCGNHSDGAVCVVSGRTGGVLVTGIGELPGDNLGSGMVTGCGDIDGDGTLDFAGSSHGGFTAPGVVRVFSGRTGAPVYGWRTGLASLWGWSLAAGDLDLDGIADLLVGYGRFRQDTNDNGRLTWLSLRDGRLVTEVFPFPLPFPATHLGTSSDVGRPQPGSPFPVFVACEPDWWSSSIPYYRGRITLFRAMPRGAEAYGYPCSGTLEAAPRIGLRDADGKGLRAHLTSAPPGVPVALLAGLSRASWGTLPLPLALDHFGFPGCSLLTSVDLFLPTLTGSTGKDRGYAFADVPIPLADANRKLTLHGQWLVPLAKGGGALSAGLTWGH